MNIELSHDLAVAVVQETMRRHRDLDTHGISDDEVDDIVRTARDGLVNAELDHVASVQSQADHLSLIDPVRVYASVDAQRAVTWMAAMRGSVVAVEPTATALLDELRGLPNER